MPVSVVVGGQFGSEGKGKVAYHFAKKLEASAVVRVGGPNSGHTVVDDNGNRIVFQHLPTASILPKVICFVPAGSYISPEVLLSEIKKTKLTPERLIVDPNAMIISEEDVAIERAKKLTERIGSTASGTGEAVIRRINRGRSVKLAREEDQLRPYVRPTMPFMRRLLDDGKRVIVEGTQGFGLSLLHSSYYPFATSRDTTAAGFISEAGLSPLDVDDVILVIRSFPIRVAGNSGPLPSETDWDELTRTSGSKGKLVEYTSVTHRVRRVGKFDPGVVQKAIMANQ